MLCIIIDLERAGRKSPIYELASARFVGVDYIILDGRGGGTGAAPLIFRDNISVPTIPGLARARRYLDKKGCSDVSLVITGGLRLPADFIKALALGADAIAVLSMSAGCQENSGTISLQAIQPTIHDVSLSRIEKRVQPVIYEVPGSVVPAQRLQITSRISGYIEQVHVDEGDHVEVGAALLDIDDAQFEANIRAAQASLASAKAELADARADVERYQSLVTKQVLAEDQLRDAQVRSALADAQVEKMQAELDARREDRRYVRLKSPTRALVRERLYGPGDLVTAGEPVLRIDVLGAMEFEVGEEKEDAFVRLYDRVLRNRHRLPPGAGEPRIQAIDVDDVPVFTLTLASDQYYDFELRRMAERVLERLRSVEGIGLGYVVGGAQGSCGSRSHGTPPGLRD